MRKVEYKQVVPDRWHVHYAQQVSEWIAAAIKKRNPHVTKRTGAAAVATVWAIKRARELFSNRKIIAIANPIGAKALLEKHGGRVMSYDVLPSETFELCGTCPRKHERQPGQKRCDQPIDLTYSHLE